MFYLGYEFTSKYIKSILTRWVSCQAPITDTEFSIFGRFSRWGLINLKYDIKQII